MSDTFLIKRNKTDQTVLDLYLDIDSCNKLSELKVKFLFYPFSREMKAEDYYIFPYEEYVNDINKGKRSSYSNQTSKQGMLFGLVLGILICFIVYLYKPSDLLSVESIVSIIGAFLLGKELWPDINDFLSNLTHKLPVSWRNYFYPYKRQKQDSLNKYSVLARENRYQDTSIYPDYFDYIEHSNSKRVDLYFKDLTCFHEEDKVRIASMHFPHETVDQITSSNYMSAVRFIKIKKFLFFRTETHYFQGMKNGKIGEITNNEKWQNGLISEQRYLCLGKFSLLIKRTSLKDKFIKLV